MSSSNNKIKVLITGPVKSSFTALHSKLTTLQKSKAGPFDVCFCTGPFFDSTSTTNKEETEKVISGDIEFPLPVFFVDVGRLPPGVSLPPRKGLEKKDEDEIEIDDDMEEDENTKKKSWGDIEEELPSLDGIHPITTNLYQLNGIPLSSSKKEEESHANVINVPIPPTTTKPSVYNTLVVSFLPPNKRYNTKDTKYLQEKTGHGAYLGCDLFLSSEWGQGMIQPPDSSSSSNSQNMFHAADQLRLTTLLSDSQSTNSTTIGSYDVAECASATRPRYHFAPGIQSLHSFTSLPYQNVPSSSSGSTTYYHPCRFVSLGCVRKGKVKKEEKFIHAVGIQPLLSMDKVTSLDGESGGGAGGEGVMKNPYTDDSYQKDSTFTASSSSNVGGGGGGSVGGVSEATARRILQEENSSSQFRFTANKKRPYSQLQQQQQTQASNDPNNKTLFIHGINRLAEKSSDPPNITLLEAFSPFKCIKVKLPPQRTAAGGGGDRRKNFAFVEFENHEAALDCLQSLNGEIVIHNVTLEVKWSSGGGGNQQLQQQQRGGMVPLPPPPMGNIHPPPPIMGGPIPPPPPPKKQRNRLTEAEASTSTTLFLRLPPSPDASSSPSYAHTMETLRLFVQSTLVEIINSDGTTSPNNEEQSKVTAEEEPALQVSIRHPSNHPNYAFLSFASHAAASMALATLTQSTDGGYIDQGLLSQHVTLKDLRNVSLYWAKGESSKEGSGGGGGEQQQQQQRRRNQRPPKDTRTDCWFCLASPTFEKHLLVSIYKSCYIAMPRGPLDTHHVLLIPIDHEKRGCAYLSEGAYQEMEKIKEKIREFVRNVLKKDLFVFERAVETKGGYHTHVQCVPVASSSSNVEYVMMEMAREIGFEMKELGSGLTLKQIMASEDEDEEEDEEGDDENGEKKKKEGGRRKIGEGYFYAEVPLSGGGGGEYKRFLYKMKPKNTASNNNNNKTDDAEKTKEESSSDNDKAGDNQQQHDNNNNNSNGNNTFVTVPLQFGREVVARVMDNPNLVEWKECVKSVEEEEGMAKLFRDEFEKMMQGDGSTK